MTVKQIIKDIISAYDPTLDLNNSSSLTDLLINPASAMMDPFIAQLQFLIGNLGMNDPVNINNEELDAIAANFLMTRDAGTKAAGYVEILYLEPTSVSVLPGTKFTTNTGVEFETVQQFYVPSEIMQENAWNYPYYSSGPIPVVAVEVGLAGTILPGDIVATTDVDPAPARVTNPAEFTGGTDAETNEEFVARIMEEMVSGALGSAQSIKTSLMKNFTTIKGISVRGMGDPEMQRDLVASGVSLTDLQTKIDFYGKVSGLNDLPYPESRAYRGTYYDEPTSSGIQPDLPLITSFTTEFSNAEYSGMYKLNDSTKATINTLEVLNEPFSSPTLDTKWTLSDAREGQGLLTSPIEIVIEERNGLNKLRMGRYVTDAEVDNMTVYVPAKFLYNVLNLLKRATEMPAGTGAHQAEVTTYAHVKTIIEEAS